MSSGIDALFCAYCAHSTGINTHSQKMHENKVSKVEMWLVVEEVRAHKSVMAWGMVFDVVVPKVGAYWDQANREVALAGAIPDPVEAYVNHL